MRTVQYYREQASHARRLAASVADPGVREQLEIAASDYDQIADDLEMPPADPAAEPFR